jgi:hypothetical protein
VKKSKDYTLIKKYSSLIHEVKNKVKTDTCMICGEKYSSMCNSHNIPVFILNQIAENGYIYDVNFHIKESIQYDLNRPKGINKTQIFKNICCNCDNLVFKPIEEPQHYLTNFYFSNYQLNLMALKQILYYYNKRQMGLAQIQTIADNYEVSDNRNLLFWWYYDVKNIQKNLKQLIDSNYRLKYKVIFETTIEKKTDFAFSNFVIPKFDFLGNIINRLNVRYNKNYDFGCIHISVLPFSSTETKVLIFYAKKYHNFDLIYEQFNRVDDAQKLKYISDMILLYSDQFVNNSNLNKKLESIQWLFTIDVNQVKYKQDYLNFVLDIRSFNIFN